MLATFLFILRHFLFVVFAMVAGCLLWTIAYVLLLVIAVVGDFGLGGPLAYPVGLVAVIVGSAVLGWGIFAPASALGAVLCALLRLPRLAAIPFVAAAAYGLSYLLYRAYIEWVTTHPMPDAGVVLKNFAVYLSIPLGIYWWLAEGPGAVFDAFRCWLRARAARMTG